MNIIDIAALAQLKTISIKTNETADVDQTLFSETIEKFSAQNGTQESKDLKGESSQTPFESEETEDTKEEEVDFTLIHPFARLHQSLDELPIEPGLTALHNKTIEASDTQEVLDTLKADGMILQSESTDSQILKSPSVLSALNEESAQLIEEGPVEENHNEDRDNTRLNGTKILDRSSVNTEHDATKSSNTDNKQVEGKDVLTLLDGSSSETRPVESEQTAAGPGQPGFNNTLKDTHVQKNDSVDGILHQSVRTTEEVSEQEKELFTEPLTNFSLKKSDMQNNSIEIKPFEQNLSQIGSTDTQVVKTSPEIMAQPAAPVTQAQSLDVISEMLMTVSTESNGEKTYNSTITLTPETLGEVKVELVYTKEGISGRLVFSSEESREWMENQWNQMKLPLDTKGIVLNKFEFTVVEPTAVLQQNADTFAQSGQQFDQQSQQQPSETSQSVRHSLIASEDSEETGRQAESRDSRSGLNLYV